ncbi:hypothetical protein O6P43_020217 [Quillaja saponaria]|uniref:Uncharacterized protein n=1 Tax=Quillaja saponaria TaxID=32244 RepID=A0AAD7LKA3_QUISA|nr:hypothetical protein O6P43_020217 [Quillaja saponaria]
MGWLDNLCSWLQSLSPVLAMALSTLAALFWALFAQVLVVGFGLPLAIQLVYQEPSIPTDRFVTYGLYSDKVYIEIAYLKPKGEICSHVRL